MNTPAHAIINPALPGRKWSLPPQRPILAGAIGCVHLAFGIYAVTVWGGFD